MEVQIVRGDETVMAFMVAFCLPIITSLEFGSTVKASIQEVPTALKPLVRGSV